MAHKLKQAGLFSVSVSLDHRHIPERRRNPGGCLRGAVTRDDRA
jgi:hypothetical protein